MEKKVELTFIDKITIPRSKKYKEFIEEMENTPVEAWYMDGEREFTKQELKFLEYYHMKQQEYSKKQDFYDSQNQKNIIKMDAKIEQQGKKEKWIAENKDRLDKDYFKPFENFNTSPNEIMSKKEWYEDAYEREVKKTQSYQSKKDISVLDKQDIKTAIEAQGLDKKLSKEEIENLMKLKPSELKNIELPFSKETADSLKKQGVDFDVKDNTIKFKAKFMVQQEAFKVEDNLKNVKLLEKEEVPYKRNNGFLEITKSNLKKLGFGVLALLNPVAAAAVYIATRKTEVDNAFGLSKEQMKTLRNGGIVVKNEKLLQLDKETNNIFSVSKNDIKIGKEIQGVKLTEFEKTKLKNGIPVNLKTNEGKKFEAKIDLFSKDGISINTLNKKIQQKSSKGFKFSM